MKINTKRFPKKKMEYIGRILLNQEVDAVGNLSMVRIIY